MGKKSSRSNKRRAPEPAPPQMTVRPLGLWLMALVIASLGFLIYSNTFNASFQFDDETSITKNFNIQHLENVVAIWKFWPTRFLTYLSFALNYHADNQGVFGFHAVNLLIHIAASLAVAWLVLLLFRTPALRGDRAAGAAPWIAFFAGLIFVSHPIQTQGVTYITQRAVSMAAFFYLAALCCYVKSRLLEAEGDFGFWMWHKGALGFALAAIFTKEMTLTLPLAVWLMEKFFLGPDAKTPWKRLAPFFVIVLVMPLTMMAARSVDFAGMRRVGEPVPNISPYSYLVTEFRVMMTYLRLLFVPLNQNLDYDYQVYSSIFLAPTFWSFAFLATLVGLAVKFARRMRLVSFGILFFFLALMPESSVIPIRDVIFEHRLYLSMLGFSIFLPVLLYYAVGSRDMRRMIAIFALFIGWFAFLTYQRNFVWQDQLTMWNDSVKKAPNKSRGYKGRGFEFEKAGDIEKAMAEYDKAIALNPAFDEVYYNKANIYTAQKKLDLAIENYGKAIALKPDYAIAYHNRGLVYAMLGDNEKAIVDLNKAIELQPDYTLAYRNRGYYYAKLGEYERALVDYDKAAQMDPSYAQVYNERGAVYAGLGNYARALEDYEKALRLNLRTSDVYSNMGFAYYATNRFDEALRHLTTAIQINPDNASAYHNRGQVYGTKGDNESAIQDFSKTIALNPGYFVAYRNRGMIEASIGQKDKAMADYSKAIEINPAYALAYADRATLYFEQGDFSRAADDIKKAEGLGFKIDEKLVKAVTERSSGPSGKLSKK